MIPPGSRHILITGHRRQRGGTDTPVDRATVLARHATVVLSGAASFIPIAVQAADASPGVDSGGVVKALLALALVLVVVFAIAWVARRFSPTTMGASSMKLQGGLSVGARERVMLVEVKDTWLVLGVAPGRVNLLHTLPRPEESALPSTKPTNDGTFASWLSNAIKRQTNA